MSCLKCNGEGTLAGARKRPVRCGECNGTGRRFGLLILPLLALAACTPEPPTHRLNQEKRAQLFNQCLERAAVPNNLADDGAVSDVVYNCNQAAREMSYEELPK